MVRLKEILTGVPAWHFSGLTFILILWLTLAPEPLGENPPPLFEGADKVAHALMFGFFALMILLDYWRCHDFKKLKKSIIAVSVMMACATGLIIEFLQEFMNLGWSFEYGDLAADFIGALAGGVAWWIIQDRVSKKV